MKPKRLLDLYIAPRRNGIFYSMSKENDFAELFNNLGMTNENDYHSMDFDYLFNHSGLKTISVMLEQIMNGYIEDSDGNYVYTPQGMKISWDYMLLQVDQDIIDMVIRHKFLKKWKGLADTLNYDYDPLNPFKMLIDETIKNDLSSKETGSSDRTSTFKSDNTGDRSGTDKTDNKLGSINQIYGFDSGEGSNADETNSTNNIDRATSSEYTDKIDSNDTVEYSSEGTYSRENNVIRETARTGNIGNMSAQQLVEQQRELLRYQIFDIIYNDLDSVLTRSKYI